MRFEAIEQEIRTWDDAQLRKLQALVAVLRLHYDNPSFLRKMAELIDDKSPERWVTPEMFHERLKLPLEQ